MAKVIIRGSTPSASDMRGFTSIIYGTVTSTGKAINRITATNDFFSFDSFVNDTKNWFATPSRAVMEDDGETVKARYNLIEIDKDIQTCLLQYQGEHKPLCDRNPNLDDVEFLFTENTNENQLKYGCFYKLTVKGDGWEVPNISIFKRVSGEVEIGAIPGIKLHPLLQLDIIN